jgi:CMP-N-acetylneuraminic acid synthetase
MKIIGVIPARGGSKGVPGKNFKLLSGKPLIAYTIESALKSSLDRIIISTDNMEIVRISENYGLKVPFIRPSELASDTAKSIDVAIHALRMAEQEENLLYDAVMLLQPTAPFRSHDDIDLALAMLKKDELADSVISVVPVGGHHPARMKYIEEGVLIDPPFCEAYENQNRQELRTMFIRNGAVYLTKRATLLASSFKGKKSLAFIMPEERSINIDTPSDFEYAEWMIKRNVQ